MRIFTAVLLVASSCIAQTNPATQPAAPEPPDAAEHIAAGNQVDGLLDAMHRVGETMTSIRANVALAVVDDQTGAESVRSGTVLLQRRDQGTRVHVNFDKLVVDEKKLYRERVEYLLDGDWIVDRSYGRSADDPAGKRETHRQVKRPEEKMDLLKLGEGPFPLPIGQPRERVHAEFEIVQLPPDPDRQALVGLELTPRATNRLKDRFQSITVWVNAENGFPEVIETVDPQQIEVRTTTLTDVRLNEPVADADFVLEPIDTKVWAVTRIPLDN